MGDLKRGILIGMLSNRGIIVIGGSLQGATDKELLRWMFESFGYHWHKEIKL